MEPYYSDDHVTIYHGDSFDILHELSGIGAVVTDPPYSSGGAFRGDRAQQTTTKYVKSGTAAYRPEFAGDNRDQRSFLAWCSLWLNAARNASEPGAVLASFIDWRQLPVLTDAAVRLWPSPKARDCKGEGFDGQDLPNAALSHPGPQDATTPTDGPDGSPKVDLNPRFVEALMGVPPNWLTPSTSVETDSYRRWLQLHSLSSPAGSTSTCGVAT